MTTENDLLVAELYIKAAFPVFKVLLKDDPPTAKRFKNTLAIIVFRAKHNSGFVGATFHFNRGEVEIEDRPAEGGDIVFTFASVRKMNSFLSGGLALPAIKGFFKLKLLASFISALLMLKLMMPDNRPRSEHKRYLKVKLALYMVSTGLSKLNKSGDADMLAWTSSQPDRIYQLSVEGTDIAVYLRVKAGKTKAGRGMYQRKRPFVHLKFHSVDGALKVLLKDLEFVDAVDNKYISVEGSPEYAANLNDFMMRVQALTT